MMTRYEHENVVWVDLESPTNDEIQEVINEFSLSQPLAQELLSPTNKPRVDMYPDHTYAVFHFISVPRTHTPSQQHEIDVLLGKHYMITVHYGPMDPIQDLARSFEAAMLLGSKKKEKLHSGHMFFELAQRLYKETEGELDILESKIEKIESDIFDGKEKQMVAAISNTSRELLSYKRQLGTHEETLSSFEHAATSLFGESYRGYFHSAATLHARAYHHALTMNDILNELRETNMALLSTRQNEVMKNLTIMAFVTFPLTLIAAVFGMNTTHTPFIGYPNDFWIILGTMALLTIVFFAYFKLKKWF